MTEIQKELYKGAKSTFEAAIEKVKEMHVISLSDIYVSVTVYPGNYTLRIYDDMENLLTESTLEGEASYDALVETLEQLFAEESTVAALESVNITTPFSVILVDEAMAQIKELATIDPDNLQLNDDFFEKADKELDLFFQELMKDI